MTGLCAKVDRGVKDRRRERKSFQAKGTACAKSQRHMDGEVDRGQTREDPVIYVQKSFLYCKNKEKSGKDFKNGVT